MKLVKAHFSSSIHFLVSSVLASTLIGCGSAPTQPEQTAASNVETVYKVKATKTQKKNSQYFIAQAEQSPESQNRRLYIQAASHAVKEGRDLSYVAAIVERVDTNAFSSPADDLQLLKILMQLDQQEEAAVLMERLKNGVLPKPLQLSFWLLQAQYTSLLGEDIKAVKTLFQIQNLHDARLSSEDKALIGTLLWKHILKIPENTLNQFSRDFGEPAQPWISLAQVINQNLANPSELKRRLDLWQRQHPAFVTSIQMPESLHQLVTTPSFSPRRVLLLLPYSGKLAKQATNVRNGVLHAAKDTSNVEFWFLDSEKHSLQEVETLIQEQNIEFVLGPLQKDKVQSYLQSPIFQSVAKLMLNKPDNLTQESLLSANTFFFSLSPEDEVKQAVDYLTEQNYQHPAIIYADNSLGRRLASQFNTSWQSLHDKEPESIAFQNKSKLGEAVKQLLDVSASTDRINNMKRMFGTTLETETRSRSDIDAVYVIANAQQTRLIKPFFDVNVSTFGKRLPVFSSSRSYLVGESREQKRDLNGLTFTEMPWLIQNINPQASQVFETTEENQTQLKKLFAFGYDAYQLIKMLKPLEILDDYQVRALTGELSVNADSMIKRDLTWSQYRQGRVIAVR